MSSEKSCSTHSHLGGKRNINYIQPKCVLWCEWISDEANSSGQRAFPHQHMHVAPKQCATERAFFVFSFPSNLTLRSFFFVLHAQNATIFLGALLCNGTKDLFLFSSEKKEKKKCLPTRRRTNARRRKIISQNGFCSCLISFMVFTEKKEKEKIFIRRYFLVPAFETSFCFAHRLHGARRFTSEMNATKMSLFMENSVTCAFSNAVGESN